jgi:hypothetical protein
MKIFKILLVSALGLSGYLGYNNYQDLALKYVMEKVSPSIPEASEAAKERARSSPVKEKKVDYIEIIIVIGESLFPLLVPVLAARRKKQPNGTIRTLDDTIGDLALSMGMSRKLIRQKLGLGDQRAKQSVTSHQRRRSDGK